MYSEATVKFKTVGQFHGDDGEARKRAVFVIPRILFDSPYVLLTFAICACQSYLLAEKIIMRNYYISLGRKLHVPCCNTEA